MRRVQEKQVKSYEPLKITAKQSGLFFSIAIVVMLVVSIVFQLLLLGKDFEVIKSREWYTYLSYGLTSVSLLLAMLLSCKLTKVDFFMPIRELKFKKIYLAVIPLCFLGMALALINLDGFISLGLSKIGITGNASQLPQFSARTFILCSLIIAVFAPFFEEYLLRGFVLEGLKGFSMPFVIILSGAIFAIYHMSPSQTFYPFVTGMLFAFIAIKSKSVIPSMILHFLNNFYLIVGTYGLNFIGNGVIRNILKPSIKLSILLIAIGLVCLLAGILLVVLFDKEEKATQTKAYEPQSRKDFFIGALAGIFATVVMWVASLF